MSLADELLADLEDDYDYDRDNELSGTSYDQTDNGANTNEIKEDPMDFDHQISSVSEIAKLRNSERLEHILNEIERLKNSSNAVLNESDDEYAIIVEANNIAADIDNDINTIHRFTKDKYQKRFPELESLVVSPMEYMMTVQELGTFNQFAQKT